ncbi:MAG: acyl-protein synthetase [Deltaproteobacteria bacterium]|nr:acyl-protein synthetase [Deltaproteobacteria bacterium]
MPQPEKEAALLPALIRLTEHHQRACPTYRRMLEVLAPGPITALHELPWLPVGLFKSHALASVPEAEISTVLTSSGTTGQTPSRVFLDRHTARRQTVALARIMTEVLGPRRLPMLIVDHAGLLQDRSQMSARGAGVLGMMTFGARPVFVLDRDMRLDRDALAGFLARHGNAPFLIFGFTYMVWQLVEALADGEVDLSRGILVHTGGWKHLHDRAVDNTVFKATLRRRTGLERVSSFYGMAEQVGSVFVEDADGYLVPPAFADVIVRDPITLAPVPTGTVGVLQVVSVIPTSYPGHSLLTEDLGVVHHVDGPGWCGKKLTVLGRIPRAELRGCSDTAAAERA